MPTILPRLCTADEFAALDKENLRPHRLIDVHQSGKDVVTLDDAASLEGFAIVPGFTAPVARIFG